MTDFQCFSESLSLTTPAWNCQGIFGHVTLHLKCLHCLQQARWVLTTETPDSIWRPNWSAGNYISPFKLLASLSWIKCSLPSWNCCHVLGNSCCDKVRGQLLRGQDWRIGGTRPCKPRYHCCPGLARTLGAPRAFQGFGTDWTRAWLVRGIEKGSKPSALDLWGWVRGCHCPKHCLQCLIWDSDTSLGAHAAPMTWFCHGSVCMWDQVHRHLSQRQAEWMAQLRKSWWNTDLALFLPCSTGEVHSLSSRSL